MTPSSLVRSLVRLGLVVTSMALWPCVLRAEESDAARAAQRFFETQVRPVLATHCYECHGADKQKGGLRADHLKHLLQGGESGPALQPGDPEASLLVQAIRYEDSNLQMPPKKRLPVEAVTALEKWIAMGAYWPEGEVPKEDPATTRDEHGFTQAEREHWSLRPLAEVDVPQISDPELAQWVRTEIDHFVAAKYLELGLRPAPPADPQELVRRLYYDLHGLPPTPEQQRVFLEDPSGEAYERLVDELLASPRYGERWAQHWLDLVRYAESDGYNADHYREAAWPYRDWVIKAFNEDMPYDRFVRYQLAGDEIAPDDPEVFIATSYLRNGIYEWNQRDVRGQWEIILTDITDNAGEVFLGLSFGCARCHDHKFDPIRQEDYYRLKAFFTPILWDDHKKLATPEALKEYEAKFALWEEATREIRSEMEAMTGPALEKRIQAAYNRFSEDIRAMIDKPVAERSPLEHQLASIATRQMTYERKRFQPMSVLKKEEERKRYQELEEALRAYDHLKPEPPMEAFVATDAKPLGPPNLLKTRRVEMDVPPGFLKILEPALPEIRPSETTTRRRSALADWIVQPDNRLSTRVMANRIWQYHFGRGIAGTPNDLGKMGESPTHPELLDWLARDFVAGGWRLKRVHRQIVLSAVYRQTARRQMPADYAGIDPGNQYLWRFHPRRLDAEQARDSMLAASGELDLTAGGPSVEGNAPRRSIYTIKKRNSQDEFLRQLDATANFTSVSERQSTTTPTQALYLMNGDWLMQRAEQLAARAGSIERAWEYTLGRPPQAEERRLMESFIARRTAEELELVEAALRAMAQPVPASRFRPGTRQERLLVELAENQTEGDEFTVEAVFTLDSIDTGGAVRTLASRWSGGNSQPEHRGWSLGVTGEKSRFQPRNLLLQVVGNREDGSLIHELIPSDLRVQEGVPYHVAMRFSAKTGKAAFTLTDLSKEGVAPAQAERSHAIRGGHLDGNSRLVIGGLSQRAPSHQFHGELKACRLIPSWAGEGLLSPDPDQWRRETTALVLWDMRQPLPENLSWSKESPDLFAAEADFKVDSEKERLVASLAQRENENFTIEAVVKLRSIDRNAGVRTIASRWAGGQDKPESFGWSLGVSGEKSRFKPANLIVQLVGFDENDNINYEVVPSGIHLALNTPYHIVAQISLGDHQVSYRVTDLSAPGSETLVARAKHEIRRGITTGRSNLVIGGMNQRNPSQQFDGWIVGCRVVNGELDREAANADPEQWRPHPFTVVEWNATRPQSPFLAKASKDHHPQGGDVYQRILADLCHVLFNSNEFLYLH